MGENHKFYEGITNRAIPDFDKLFVEENKLYGRNYSSHPWKNWEFPAVFISILPDNWEDALKEYRAKLAAQEGLT